MARPVTKLSEIEKAAIRLFALRGVGRVTLKDIAAEADCAEGALYRHYSGMEEMAWRLFKREVEDFGRKVQTVLTSPKSFPERIRESVSLFYRFFDEDRITFTFILLSQHQFPRDRHLNPQLNPENLVFSFIKEGVEAGAFGIEDEKLGTAMVMGLVLMPATLCATGGLKGPMQTRIDQTTRACLQVLRARKEKRSVRQRRR